MPPRLLHPDEYELVVRDSSDSNDTFDIDDADFESQGLTTASYVHDRNPKSSLRWLLLLVKSIFNRRSYRQRPTKRSKGHRFGLHRFALRRICFVLQGFLGIILALISLTAIFRPSYTRPPPHYEALRQRVIQSKANGRANPDNQKVFIAASIYDKGGHLVNGAWGKGVLDLIELLGNHNVFLSIYENDSGAEAQSALQSFEDKVQCQHSLIFEEHLSVDDIPKVKLPDGSTRVKRIAYLAEIRNRALLPLDKPSDTKYDRLIFLNDIIFNPMDAAQLLLSTNLDENGKPSYRAACAVDFINPFKFYDTFATRDAEGYSMGVPFFPWYSSAGKGLSRQDVLNGKDAIKVKSCWGGMVAFDANLFQTELSAGVLTDAKATQTEVNVAAALQPGSNSQTIRFRAETDLYWDASECCLIHADLQSASLSKGLNGNVGTYHNPFIRVAYDSRTLWWLQYTRRFERLYTVPQYIVDWLVGLPWFNPRRTEIEGSKVTEMVWTPDNGLEAGGTFQAVPRVATGAGFCGLRTLQLIRETPREGDKNWETMPIPPP